MVLQNKHQEKALNDLAAAHAKVAGERYEYQDLVISLALLERALADALSTRVELLSLDDSELESLDYNLKAHVGRVLAVRATMLFDMQELDFAAHSARLATQAFRETLEFHFDDEDRYVANLFHQLLTRDVCSIAFRPSQIADFYELLFDYYSEARLLDRAEDMLFHAIELHENPEHLYRKGLEFYDELITLETRYLQKRGLPRHEVNESRREILHYLTKD